VDGFLTRRGVFFKRGTSRKSLFPSLPSKVQPSSFPSFPSVLFRPSQPGEHGTEGNKGNEADETEAIPGKPSLRFLKNSVMHPWLRVSRNLTFVPSTTAYTPLS
jgi:hypothetical protein